MVRGILLIFLWFIPALTFGQLEPENFIHLTTLDGLNDHSITALEQDEMGYIWIGTYEGLHRYDGLTFKKYLHSADSSSIPNNFIWGLKYVGQDRMLILTRCGMQLLNTRTQHSTNYIIPDTTQFRLYCNSFWDAIEIPGTGFLTSTRTGFYLFNYKGKLVWRYDQFTLKDLGKGMLYGREFYRLPDNSILCYYDGNGEAKRFDPTTFTLTECDPELSAFNFIKPLLHYGGHRVQVDSNTYLMTEWQHNDGLVFNLKENKIENFPLHHDPKTELDWPALLYKARDTLILQTGGNGGFFLYRRKDKNAQFISDGIRLFPGNRVWAALLDRNNRWWIGTDHGLYMETFQTKVIKMYPVREYIKPFNESGYISKLLPVGDQLFMSAGIKDGVTVLESTSMTFQKNIRVTGLHPDWNDVHSMVQLNKDTLWFGTAMGLLYYDIKNGVEGLVKIPPFNKEPIFVSSMFKDSRSNIWLFVEWDPTGLLLYNQKEKTFRLFSHQDTTSYLPLLYVDEMAEDVEGNIWASKNGVARFNYQKMKFDTLITTFAGFEPKQSNVLTMTADRYGNLWLATEGNGLLKYSINKKTFAHFSTLNVLSRDIILEISPEIDNQVFVANRSNIDIVNIETGEVRTLGPEDGLPSTPISTTLTYDSTRQIFWAGFGDNIAIIPTHLSTNNYPPPHLLIESIHLPEDTMLYFPSGNISIPFEKNFIQVDFTWMDFDGSDHVRSYYRLDNTKEWIDLNGAHSIILNHLRPGIHPLEIKVKSNTLRWPDQIARLQIRIIPPFWRSTWFMILSLAILAELLYWTYQRHIKRIQEKANADVLLADYKMKALHSQMNPHFIFNCLNSIKEMILLGEKDKAGFYLSRFAQLIRDTLDHSQRSFISLDQLIEYIKRYIEMEQIRFSDFTYTLSIDEKVKPREIKMPPMLLQPLIENAIWHGLSRLSSDKKLEIRFFYREEKLISQIIDNGVGITATMKNKKENHTSTGIDNIHNRIALLNEKYQVSSSLAISDRSELDPTQQGTIAELAIFIEPE